MTDPRNELLQIVADYEAAARVLPAAGPDAASRFSALWPAIESALGCVRRIVTAVEVRSREAQERFRQVANQARRYLQQALTDMHRHASLSVFDLLRGIKNLLQDLIHNRLVNEDRLLTLGSSDVKAILSHLKFPPRKGSKLRAALDAA